MSEWNSVFAIYGVLWAVDGVRVASQRFALWRSGWRRPGGVLRFEHFDWLGVWPGHWRIVTADVPVSLSPLGVCARPAGGVGRPADSPRVAQAYRWEEIKEVGVAAGWIFVNGQRFYPDTGHLTAPQLLALAQLAPTARERRIRVLLRLWLRPAHLRRREKVFRARTAATVALNTLSLVLLAALAAYVVSDVAAELSDEATRNVGEVIPYVLLALVGLHLAAIATGWRAVRRLRPAVARVDKRRSALLGALFFPPQALRLRALVAEGFFPAQHPLAAALALAGPVARDQWVFNALADLRWPIDDREDPPLAREISAWYRTALGAALSPLLAAAGIEMSALLAPPLANSPASCTYCPRCRDQFTAGPAVCPHGVTLLALPGYPVRPTPKA